MLRRFVIFAVVAPLAVLAVHVFLTGSGPVSSSPDLSPGEFWRLPWRATASHDIDGGNGYGYYTHQGTDYWALDLQVPEGEYVTAVQEGTVTFTSDSDACGPIEGYGRYVEIQDVSGYVHRYAHLSARFFGVGAHVQPGWAIGRSGHTGHVEPCDSSGAHVHYRITDPDSDPCTAGRCIPEPLSDQCADWSYKGYDIWCGLQGDDYAFSYDPSYDDDPWKDNNHLSNNAGVGDYPVVEGQPVTYDAAIQARYIDEGTYYQDWPSLVVGKPVNPSGAGWYVHRWDGYPPFTGVLQDFDRGQEIDIDSPDPEFGAGAMMHGDNVVHNPVDGRADIPAMWVFGDFWWKYISYCEGVQFFYYLGYPSTEQYEFDYGGFHFWWQRFQNGHVFRSDADYNVYVRDLNNEPFAPSCEGPDSDWDGVSDDFDNCPHDYNPFQENTDSGPAPSGIGAIGNGKGIAGDDATIANGDSLGDACDDDADNDGIPNGSDSDAGGDITYDDNNDGTWKGAGDDGPSWDTDMNAKRDGVEYTCTTSTADSDEDGLLDKWEACKWGSDP
jgi:murein DD-endopeptidase MepM/ murein hydrolase activator NlpD